MASAAKKSELIPLKTGFPVADQQLNASQTFPRSKKLKNEGVVIPLNLEQEIEYMKCALDPVYFAENYYKITSIDKGFILFDPFEYQRELLQAFNEHRFVIDMQCRQSGKTTVVGAFLLWFLIFNPHKEVFVLANKEKQAIEILTRVRKALLDMPFFLSPGVVKYGSTEVEFDNGSKIVAYATSSDSIRGRSCVTGDTLVTVRSREEKLIRNVDISSLYHGDTPPEEFSNIKDFSLNSEYEILTDEGFKDFKGVIKNTKEITKVLLSGGITLNCTKDHRLLTKKGWKEAQDLISNSSVVRVEGGWKKVIAVIDTGETEEVFDAIGVEDTEAYFTGGVYSHNCALLYVDEVAFIENDMDFWESTFPAVSQSETSKVIMTSTPKGQRGLFYKTWQEAEPDEHGITNGFYRVLVTWQQVPTYNKDPNWSQKQIKKLGEARFKQEFGCSFRGSVGTLLNVNTIENMVSRAPKVELDEWTKIYAKYDPDRKYIAVADVGGGVGEDYSVLRIMDVTTYPYKTAALYRNNEISPLLFPHVIVSMCEAYGSCYVLPEINNDMGGQAITVLYYDLEYEFTLKTGSDKQKGTGTKIGGRNSKPGIKTNTRTRSVGCSNMKSMIENNLIEIDDLETIYEMGNFVAKGDRYEADSGCHDDCVMTLVIFAWLCKQEWFVEEFERNVSTELYNKVTSEGGFSLPCAGGINYQDDLAELGGVSMVDGDTSGVSLEEWASR